MPSVVWFLPRAFCGSIFDREGQGDIQQYAMWLVVISGSGLRCSNFAGIENGWPPPVAWFHLGHLAVAVANDGGDVFGLPCFDAFD